MHINQKNFDLGVKMEAVAFLLAMYNVGEHLGDSLKMFDDLQQGKLEIAADIAKEMTSFTSAVKAASVDEHKGLDDDDVRSYLAEMGYQFVLPYASVRVFIYQSALD